MKTFPKRMGSVLLMVAVLLSLYAPYCAAAQEDAQAPYLLMLGDSIAYGAGVLNPDESSYGRIVADTNQYRYRNLAVPGRDSAALLQFLESGVETDADTGEEHAVRDVVAQADIICLSIGGNDYFVREDMPQLFFGVLTGADGDELDAIAETYYQNLCSVIALIREVNSDAVILLQTLYCVWYGAAAKPFHALADRVNAMIERYDRDHPGSVYVCDISPAMNGKPENLAADCIHPSAGGNVAIAEVVLQKLKELGLGTETTPVVNVPGVDWNPYETMFSGRKLRSFFFTAALMLITGNGKNIGRLIRITLQKS